MIVRAGANEQLRAAMAEPFVVHETVGRDAELPFRRLLWEWQKTLHDTFRLLTLQPDAYFALANRELPTTYPLRRIGQSIATDDRLGNKRSEFPESGDDWLSMVLDGRRCRLSSESHGSWIQDHVGKRDDGSWAFFGSFGRSFPRNLDGPILAGYEPDTEYTIGGYASPYEDLGVQLVHLIEDRASAKAPLERASKQRDIDSFLRDLQVRVSGRPTPISDDAAKRIHSEAVELFELCSDVLKEPPLPTATALEVFAEFGVPAANAPEWSARLVLPCLSHLEIRYLFATFQTEARKGGTGTLAERVALAVLAHRFDMPQHAFARKVVDGRTAEMIASDADCPICGGRHKPWRANELAREGLEKHA